MMCGNASRCIGKYVYENNLTRKRTITLETLSGIKELLLSTTENTVTEVTVDMGEPIIEEKAKTIKVKDSLYTGTIVSMGNPHFVIFIDDISTIPLQEVGPLIEKHIYFPNRTNVEFVQVLSDNRVRMRVWERGSGITQACGTGACATAVASIIHAENKFPGQVGKSSQATPSNSSIIRPFRDRYQRRLKRNRTPCALSNSLYG